jgi:hypothetical protein
MRFSPIERKRKDAQKFERYARRQGTFSFEVYIVVQIKFKMLDYINFAG